MSATAEKIKKINKSESNENLLFFTERTFLTPFTCMCLDPHHVSVSLSHWYPGSGVVLDCIDS